MVLPMTTEQYQDISVAEERPLRRNEAMQETLRDHIIRRNRDRGASCSATVCKPRTAFL